MSISKLFAFLPCWYRKLCQSHESSCSGFTERAKFSQAHLRIKPKLTRTKNKSLIPPRRIIWLSRCLGHWWALKVQSTLAQYPSEPQYNTVVLVEGKRGAQQSPERWEGEPPSLQRGLSKGFSAQRCPFGHSTCSVDLTSLKVQKQSVERRRSTITQHDPSSTILPHTTPRRKLPAYLSFLFF